MTEKETTIKQPLAPLGDRLIAYLIDFLVMQAPILVGGILIGITSGILAAINAGTHISDDVWVMTLSIVGVLSFLGWQVFDIYYLIFWTVRHEGQTIGKRVKKIRIMVVEDLEAGEIRKMTKDDMGVALMRLLFSIVDALLFWIVGIYLMNNDPNGQRFADQQAKTVVILDE